VRARTGSSLLDTPSSTPSNATTCRAVYCPGRAPALSLLARLVHADTFFAGTGSTIETCGTQAYHSSHSGYIRMPPFETTHHWPCHRRHLDRGFGRQRYGDKGSAFDILVAELGSVSLSADLGLTPKVRLNHAAYVATRLKPLESASPPPQYPGRCGVSSQTVSRNSATTVMPHS
jgi:antirestriction protein ArdC